MIIRQAVLNSVNKLVGEDPGCHPGLMLDKLSKVPENQADSKEPLQAVLRAKGEQSCFEGICSRRRNTLTSLGATQWKRTTAGPLSMHLARAGIFENAGICLHRTYGFAYIPGTGLKGMARAWAETAWLPQQDDKHKAQDLIDHVFGWGANPDRKKMIENKAVSAVHAEIDDCSGGVIFHDAWPTKWPELIADILTCHHSKYYQGKDAPGDWESPNMVSFLAAEAGSVFDFAVSPRSAKDNELMSQARAWLDNALTYLGAGAKTNSGYGAFVPVAGTDFVSSQSDRHATFAASLQLLSPGWYAGPRQEKDDCDLRPATVRGLLRWWWRTIHSAHLSVADLRELETALWGSAQHSGAIRVIVERYSGNKPAIPSPYKGADGKLDPAFVSRHRIPKVGGVQTPGIIFIAYGMQENNRRRWCVEPGAGWTIRLVARPTVFPAGSKDARAITKDLVMAQAKAALWLLCHYGGSGSKSRNGFGSFATPAELADFSLEKCRATATELRRTLGLQSHCKPGENETPSIDAMLDVVEIETGWGDAWYAMHQIGSALQTVTSSLKHNPEKRGLGLPRKIHGPLKDRALPHQDKARWQPPQDLTSIKASRRSDRHPAALLFSLDRNEGGHLLVRIAAMPDKYLRERTPDYAAHKAFLESVVPKIAESLRGTARETVGRPVSAAPAKAFTVEEKDRLKMDWPFASFNKGQKNCTAEKITEFLEKLRSFEAENDFGQLIAHYHDGLQLSNKDRRKKLGKDEILAPLVAYLQEKKAQ